MFSSNQSQPFRRYRYVIEAQFNTPAFYVFLKQLTQDKHPVQTILKTDGTTTVTKHAFENKDLVVKRYNTKNKWHFIRRLFRQSRAENCWYMSERFLQAGIQTPQKIATIQEWLGPLKLRSWFISEFIDAQDLLQHFISHSNAEGTKPLISKLFNTMRTHQLSHGDMKATNILLSQNSLYLIDLDAAKTHTNKARFDRAFKKDYLRFLKNWGNDSDLCQALKKLEPFHSQKL